MLVTCPLCCTSVIILQISFKRVTGTALVARMGSLRTKMRKVLLIVHSLHSLGEHQLASPEAVPADRLGGFHGLGGIWSSAVVAVLFQPTNQPKQTSTNLPKSHTPKPPNNEEKA